MLPLILRTFLEISYYELHVLSSITSRACAMNDSFLTTRLRQDRFGLHGMKKAKKEVPFSRAVALNNKNGFFENVSLNKSAVNFQRRKFTVLPSLSRFRTVILFSKFI